MMLAFFSMDWLWRNALAAVPIAILVAMLCRVLPCRPSTKHSLWLIVLLSLLAPPLVPQMNVVDWLAKPRNIAVESPLHSFSQTKTSQASRERTAAEVHQQILGVTVPASASVSSPDAAAPADVAANVPAVVPASVTPAIEMGPASPFDKIASVLPEVPLDVLLRDAIAHSNAQSQTASQAREPAKSDGIRESADRPSPSRLNSEAVTANLPAVAAAPKIVANEPTRSATLAAQWREWFRSVAMVRDALVRLAPIPASFWLGGCAIVLVILVIRTLRFRGILRHAVAASGDVDAAVNSASRRIGLRTPPQTLMTESRISPMVCCGHRRILLLPIALWDELDATGRNAVLLHELAHLRRRDHWVRWMDLVIGCVYWWHPVVWFVRRRLRDEADHCCDAWVTALLPAGRSAYARALLSARQFIDHSACPAPVVGLGMANNRTKQFARRLTMVMTERNSPRMSMLGAAMAIFVATAAWLTTPLWACPPDSNRDAQLAKELAAKARAKARSPRAVVVVPRSEEQQQEEATTFETYMADRDRQDHGTINDGPAAHGSFRAFRVDDDPVRDRIDRLEERLNRLTEQLEQLAAPHGQGGGFSEAGPHSNAAAPRAKRMWAGPSAPPAPPAAPAPPTAQAFPAPPAPPMAPGMPMPSVAPSAPSVNIVPGGMGGVIMRQIPNVNGEGMISRVYKLPEGKREALYGLMARSDVPVHVSSQPDGILVIATPQQHEIFAAFVRLIDPSALSETSSGGFGEARATMELHAAQAMRERMKADAHQQTLKETVAGQRARLSEMKNRVQSQRQSMMQHVQELNRRAEELAARARELQKQSGKLRSQADSMDEGPARDALESKIEAMESQANDFDAQSDKVRDQVDAIQEQMESLQAQVDDAVAQTSRRQDEMRAEIESAIQAASGYDAATESDADGDQ